MIISNELTFEVSPIRKRMLTISEVKYLLFIQTKKLSPMVLAQQLQYHQDAIKSRWNKMLYILGAQKPEEHN